jgi:hypothetical protein
VTDPTEAPAGKRRGLHLTTFVGFVVGGACCVFVGLSMAKQWHKVHEDIVHAQRGWLALALLLGACAMAVMASGWTGVLAMVGSKIRRNRVMAWYFAGELGKYIPGGVLAVVGRGELARRGGVPRSRAYVSVALSLITLYLAAMFVATGLLPFSLAGGGSLGPDALFLLLLPLGLAVLHPKILDPIVQAGSRVLKRPVEVEIPSWATAVKVVASYLPAWVFVALSTWSVAHAINPHISFAKVAFAAVLSWIVGFLVFFVPGGVGVREAVFIAFCGMNKGDATTAALAARLIFIVVDAGGAGICSPWLRHKGEDPHADAPDPDELPAPTAG